MSSTVFLKVDEDCAEVTPESKPFQTQGAATQFSVWGAGRPVCDSTQMITNQSHYPITQQKDGDIFTEIQSGLEHNIYCTLKILWS